MLSLLAFFAVLSSSPVSDVTNLPAADALLTAEPAFEEPLPTVLRALDAATDATGRVTAVNDLAKRRDARLLPLFEVLIREPDLLAAREAVRALGQITEATATRLLERTALDAPAVVAEVAFDALGAQQTFAAATVLNRLQINRVVEPQRREWASAALRRYYARYLDRFPPPRVGSPAGRSAFVLASGELAALDLMAVGFLGLNPELGAPLGFFSGAAIGLGAGYLLSRDRPIDSTQGYRMLSYTNWGALSGLSLGLAAVSDYQPASEGRLAAGLTALGATAGYLIALNDDARLPANRQMLADVSGVAGAAVGGGILLWLPSSDQALLPTAFVNATALTGLAATRTFLPKLRITTDDSAIHFSTMALAAWYAPWTAYMFDTTGNPDRVLGWFLVGGGMGWYAGMLLAHYTEDTQDIVETADVFTVYGSLLGCGAALAADIDSRAIRTGAMLAGGAGGFLLGALTAGDFELTPADESLVLIGTVYGAYQGAGFSDYARQSVDQRRGWGFVGATAGAAAALGASRVWALTPSLTGSIFAGTGLGTWTAVLGGDRFGLDQQDLLLASLIGTNAGLASTLVFVGPLGVAPERIAWAGILGLGGAGLGATGAALATASRQTIETAALAGTAVGAAAGAILAPRFSGPTVNARVRFPEILAIQPWSQKLDGTTLPGVQVVLRLD